MEQACASWTALLEWVKALFDLLKGIAWPLAAFVLVWLFRDQIRPRLGQLRKLGTSGLEFDPQPLDPARQGGIQPLPPHPMKTVNALIEQLKDELARFRDDYRETALIANLAQARVESNFEYIFGVIFQSQISALRELASKPLTLSEARKMYETAIVPTNPEFYSTVDFDAWSKFLILQQLVTVDGESVSITDLGSDFLLFVDTKKVGMVRPR
jgi:hypothetical protein